MTKEENNKKPKINKMDVMLIIICFTVVSFIAVMIWLFYRFQSVPDTLITCFFACVGGECGILGWIKNVKEKTRERQWEKEDKENEHNGK